MTQRPKGAGWASGEAGRAENPVPVRTKRRHVVGRGNCCEQGQGGHGKRAAHRVGGWVGRRVGFWRRWAQRARRKVWWCGGAGAGRGGLWVVRRASAGGQPLCTVPALARPPPQRGRPSPASLLYRRTPGASETRATPVVGGRLGGGGGAGAGQGGQGWRRPKGQRGRQPALQPSAVKPCQGAAVSPPNAVRGERGGGAAVDARGRRPTGPPEAGAHLKREAGCPWPTTTAKVTGLRPVIPRLYAPSLPHSAATPAPPRHRSRLPAHHACPAPAAHAHPWGEAAPRDSRPSTSRRAAWE